MTIQNTQKKSTFYLWALLPQNSIVHSKHTKLIRYVPIPRTNTESPRKNIRKYDVRSVMGIIEIRSKVDFFIYSFFNSCNLFRLGASSGENWSRWEREDTVSGISRGRDIRCVDARGSRAPAAGPGGYPALGRE